MIKILHTADWHIGDFKGPVKDGVNLRSLDTKKCIEKVIETAEVEKPDITMISGDIFHQAKVWGNRALEEVREATGYISKLSECSGIVIVLRGTPNHDGEPHFEVLVQYFENVTNVEIVTEPTVVHTMNMDVACIPGFDSGKYRAKFPGLSKDEENKVFSDELNNVCIGLKSICRDGIPTALMAHYTVPGCNSESGQSTFLQQFEPVLYSESIIAADYDISCLGHIHRPQKLPNVQNCFYSGAVNAMNFNDEGQERGFWIHEFEKENTISRFVETPYREFRTYHFTDVDIAAINIGSYDDVAMNFWRYNNSISGKIVRILYNCSLDNNKAFNRAVLEKNLLDDGAFYVADIVPEKLETIVDRRNVGANSDPEESLKKYLEEKGYETLKISEIISKARPIISEAIARSTTASLTGVFVPVSIEVKNYRNYVEEKFDFTDISFCTINGQNGAGKSSLFMDAIIDCLYEQPREGDLTGWIRNDEKARSGAITFTFKIGEKTFRVSRTRARSGKGTLNLAELVDGEWENRSKEKYKDTQESITQLLGMDSMTFKSCALIMQDQYGLFLQAPKEDRMVILGNLLGLGIYNTMEDISWKTAKQYGAKMRDTKNEIGIHEATISAYGNPDEEIEIRENVLKAKTTILEDKTLFRDRKNVEFLSLKEAKERADKLSSSISSLEMKKASTEANREAQLQIVTTCNSTLNEEPMILENVGKYRELERKQSDLIEGTTLYNSKKEEVARCNSSIASINTELLAESQKLQSEQSRLSIYEDTSGDEEIIAKASEYADKKQILDDLQKKAVEFSIAEKNYLLGNSKLDEATARWKSEENSIIAKRDSLSKKTELLAESGCVDIDNANCKFLQDAIASKKQLEEVQSEFDTMYANRDVELAQLKSDLEKLKYVMDSVGYSKEELASIQAECNALYPYIAKAEMVKKKSSEIALIRASIDNRQSNISNLNKRLDMAKLEANKAQSELDKYKTYFDESEKVRAEMLQLAIWLEKEKRLPVVKERKANATQRFGELEVQIAELTSDISEKKEELSTEMSKTFGYDTMQAQINSCNAEINELNEEVKELQMHIGALSQKIADISKIRETIGELQTKSKEYAIETADYDLLKAAFSQDGIPHQIIRSIIPALTDTANSILGQMTGGKMGIEFQTEKTLKSNSKKEVVTLDILIEEYGKSTLPYLSKSGGEKVKASLSVILALAETKSSSAGIQLGMLFIDEPPFLDGDGIQAYCDALETIQNRYPTLKIMAITHDQSMKARFPQSLDVIKTDDGSKVIY